MSVYAVRPWGGRGVTAIARDASGNERTSIPQPFVVNKNSAFAWNNGSGDSSLEHNLQPTGVGRSGLPVPMRYSAERAWAWARSTVSGTQTRGHRQFAWRLSLTPPATSSRAARLALPSVTPEISARL